MTSGIISLLFAYIIAGAFSPILVKLGVREFPPLIFTFLRFAMASLVMMPFFLRQKKVKLIYDKLAITNSLFFAANMALFSVAIQYTTAIMGSIIYTLVPIFVVTMDFFAGEKPDKNKIIGAVIAFSGLLFLIYQSIAEVNTLSFGTPKGNLLVFLASLTWAGYFFVSRRAHYTSSPINISMTNFVFTTLVLVPLLPLEASFRSFNLASISWIGIAAVLGTGVLSSALYIFLLQIGIKKLGSFIASLFGYIAPFFTTLTAIPVLGEKVTPATVIGGLLVLSGVFYATTYPIWLNKNYWK